jgi:hypothetical protein
MMELFRSGTRGVRQGKEVPSDSISLDALSITFCVRHPRHISECYQSILPHGDGAFSAIQLPLSGKVLLLQLDSRH